MTEQEAMYKVLNERTGTLKLNQFFNKGYQAGWKAALDWVKSGQEPVAWTNESQLGYMKDPLYKFAPMAMWSTQLYTDTRIPLYLHPAPAQPVEPPTPSKWVLREVCFDEDGTPAMHREPAVVQQLLEVVETVANNIGEFAGQLQNRRQVDQLSLYVSQLFAALKAVKGE